MKLNALLMVAFVGVASLSLPALAQVPYDLSKAVEYKTVWQMDYPEMVFPINYVKDLGGIPGFDVVFTSVRNQGAFTWKTRPKIDTNNVNPWPGAATHTIDYDGVPPLEYYYGNSLVYRAHPGENPFPLTPIDTINVIDSNWNTTYYCVGEPSFSADIDGDGYLDVLTTGDGHVGRIIRGGPMAGKGCQRVFTIDPYRPSANVDAYSYEFFRGSHGQWTLVQEERAKYSSYGYLRIYRIGFIHEADSIRVTYALQGSLKGVGKSVDDNSFGGSLAVVDTAAGKDWLLLYHYRTWGQPFMLERFDITDGQFNETGEKVLGVSLLGAPGVLGYQLGTTRPTVVLSAASDILTGVLSYVDDVLHPFAKVLCPGFASWAVINDQTGDGKPDILMSNWPSPSGAIRLMSGDTSLTSVTEQTGASGYSARLSGHELLVTLAAPCLVGADLVTLDGRLAGTLPARPAAAGVTRLPLASLLDGVAPGMYLLRVRLGEQMVTLSLLK